jgi:hypothetical protein
MREEMIVFLNHQVRSTKGKKGRHKARESIK